MNPLDFLETARDLATSSARRPRQTNLRRAVSTTYYALFHCLAKCCADMVVGGAGSNRSRPAWRQTYRALGHGTARKRCEHQKNIRRFPTELQDLANVFVDMQKKRHGADYDPDAVFPKRDVLQDIDEADTVIRGFPAASAKAGGPLSSIFCWTSGPEGGTKPAARGVRHDGRQDHAVMVLVKATKDSEAGGPAGAPARAAAGQSAST